MGRFDEPPPEDPGHGYDRAGYDPARDADEEWARREADAGPPRCVCCYHPVTIPRSCFDCASGADDRKVFAPCTRCRKCSVHCLCQPEDGLSPEEDADDDTGDC